MIGVAWAVLQPILLASVFSVFLGLLAKVPSDYGVPYPVFAVAGLVLWIFFSLALSRAADSAVASGPAHLEGVVPAHHHPLSPRCSRPPWTS